MQWLLRQPVAAAVSEAQTTNQCNNTDSKSDRQRRERLQLHLQQETRRSGQCSRHLLVTPPENRRSATERVVAADDREEVCGKAGTTLR